MKHEQKERKEKTTCVAEETKNQISLDRMKRTKKSFKSRHRKTTPCTQTSSHTPRILDPCRNTSDRPPRAADQIPGAGWSVTACRKTNRYPLQNHCGSLQGTGSEWAVISNFVLRMTTNEHRRLGLDFQSERVHQTNFRTHSLTSHQGCRVRLLIGLGSATKSIHFQHMGGCIRPR